jgi:excisionase family DNA binding protein
MKTPNQIAALFSVTPTVVRKLARLGKIPAYRVGGVWRMDEKKVRAFFANKTQAAFDKTRL